MGQGITSHRIKRLEDRLDTAESDIDTAESDVDDLEAAALHSWSGTLSGTFTPNSETLTRINLWQEDVADADYFTLGSNRDLVVTEAGRYLIGCNLRFHQNTTYAATYVACGMFQESVLIPGTAQYATIDGNEGVGRSHPVSCTQVVVASAGDTFDVQVRDGEVGNKIHDLQTNGTAFWAVKLT